MSREWVVLTRDRPDLTDLPALLGDDLTAEAGCVFDTGDRLLVRLTAPVLVPVPGETERLLGISFACPAWWTEIRSAAGIDAAEKAARRCADGLAQRHSGTVWSGGAP
ncbi:hypothetical protein [Actinomadura rayongensis]|uniref:Uncharacterized protein n=1 Tax=Actinomadura rayongensis TaxID=1429076 RepID=A0A6I4W7U1_9ACTN|nr:hypothetical protein [Actinomadura rayongensis]MXQ64315.1 hypothetical protein [Actinomadura rayongensis]